MIHKRVNGIISELFNITDYLQVVSNPYNIIKSVGTFSYQCTRLYKNNF